MSPEKINIFRRKYLLFIGKSGGWGNSFFFFIYATNFQDVKWHRNKRRQFQHQAAWGKTPPH